MILVLTLLVFYFTNQKSNSELCFTTNNVRNNYGKNSCVEFKIGYTYETKAGTKFLDEKSNYTEGFVVYIPRDSEYSSIDLNTMKNKNIRVYGLIKEYQGYPEIVVTEYSQVKILN